MASEQKLKEDIARADRADRILADSLVKDALQSIKETLYHNIESSSWRSRNEREECYRMLKVVDKFKEQFEQHLKTGKLARSRLDELLNKIKR